MEKEKQERLARQLESPLGFRRRSAVKQLAVSPTAATVPLLVSALQGTDAKASALAEAALRNLSGDEAIDAFCAAWEAQRSPQLEAILTERRYSATSPPLLRALTTLKTGGTPEMESDGDIHAVAQALDDKDPAIAAAARQVVRTLKNKIVLDKMLDLAMTAPRGTLATCCAEAGFRHTAPDRDSLFRVLTGQADAFFHDFRGKEEEGLRLLRHAYDQGDELLRAEVMAVVRSGDRRFAPFFDLGLARHEMAEKDLLTDIELRLRNQDWPGLFALFREIPMKYGYPLLEAFRKSGWEPDDADGRNLYRRLLERSKGHAVTAGDSVAASAAPRALADLLDQAEPLEAMGAVVALAAIGADDAIRRAVAENKHWGVRLAGRATGLCPDSLYRADDPALQAQVKPVSPSVADVDLGIPALELWPSRAALRDMQALRELPETAFKGKLGAVRKVLRLLLADSMRMIEGWVDMTHVEEGAITGGFEPD